MILDTSAAVAVIRGEPSANSLVECLARGGQPLMSAASYVELRCVASRDARERHAIDLFLERFEVMIVPFDEAQARLAATAYDRYGRGSGHPAKLNLGDTYSYALAMIRNEPLLFVGDDFSRTDVLSAL